MIKPAKLFSFFFIPLVMAFIPFTNLYSTTNITITLDPTADLVLDTGDFETSKMENQIQDTSDKNGPFVANAFALANVLGFPIGKSYLGAFPSFELGISGGAGCTNMEYYDKTELAHNNGTRPMFAPNPILHFGMGIAGGVDIIGKIFYLSKSFVDHYKSDIKYGNDVFKVTDYKVYSVGGKLRYNYIKEKKFLPFYLSFGGVTFSLGGNFMYGDINVTGNYKYDFKNITVTNPGPGPASYEVPINFDGQYQTKIHWTIFTVDAQAIAYFDIFYFISLYSGFGVAGNIGSFNIKFIGSGNATSDDPNYFGITGTNNVGRIDFMTKNSYRPSPVIPLYILGFEINILVLKLNAETMVNLLNRSDVNAQVGTRLQF